MQNHKRNTVLGHIGENNAERYIKNEGMLIVERNYRCPYGEVDIIAKDGDCIVFIEVKYRKNTNYGHPLEAVNGKKQHKIRNCAEYYIAENGIDGNIRFDVMGILDTDYIYLKNAF